MKTHYQNWQVKVENDIAWLYCDRVDNSTNTIDQAVLKELESILIEVADTKNLKGLIVTSAKSNSFIAGADIKEISQLHDKAQALSFIQKGQTVFAQLAALPIPTVALINGFCLGGGMELALACSYRVATDSAKTKLGLPEILLGLHPGWGGTVRLPRLIGSMRAMDLILTGRTVSAQQALKLNLIDAVVPECGLIRAAIHYITMRPKSSQLNWLQSMSNHTLIRPIIGKLLTHSVNEKISADHYPAPFAVINNWEKEGIDNPHAFVVEAESLAEIAMTETAANLIRVFFLRERLKAFSKNVKVEIEHIHVVGAGTMGADIAAWCALQGLRVTLQDREAKFIAPAIKRAHGLFAKKLKTPRLIQAAMDRLVPDIQGYGVVNADIIIEAIYENLEAKQNLFKQIEQQCKPEAILATNTSSIPLDEINKVLHKPERLVGIHFFNPVALMQLVEVVRSEVTSAEIFDKATAFVHQIDRLPLPVKSSPGFLINRVLMPYLLAAMQMLQEGIAAPILDKTAIKFGMPMGPIELADTIGLDVCLAVAKELGHYLGHQIPEQLEKMVVNGKLGRKVGEGFYKYKNGKPEKEKVLANSQAQTDIIDRLITPMINEAEKCLVEGVVTDSDLVDAGMIFGTGFAPFRGGLLHYAAQQKQ